MFAGLGKSKSKKKKSRKRRRRFLKVAAITAVVAGATAAVILSGGTAAPAAAGIGAKIAGAGASKVVGAVAAPAGGVIQDALIQKGIPAITAAVMEQQMQAGKMPIPQDIAPQIGKVQPISAGMFGEMGYVLPFTLIAGVAAIFFFGKKGAV